MAFEKSPTAPQSAEPPKDLLSALEGAPADDMGPAEEPEEDGADLDAEQLDLASQMGMDKPKAIALRRFIESLR